MKRLVLITKLALITLALVVPIVLLGYLAVGGMAGALLGPPGRWSGSSDNEAERQAKRTCDRDVATVTTWFARRVGRLEAGPGPGSGWGDALPNPDQAACMVWVEVPKNAVTVGVDPNEAIRTDIDDAVRPLGWKQTRPGTWVNRKGSRVRTEIEMEELPVDDHAVTAYEFPLYGRSVDGRRSGERDNQRPSGSSMAR